MQHYMVAVILSPIRHVSKYFTVRNQAYDETQSKTHETFCRFSLQIEYLLVTILLRFLDIFCCPFLEAYMLLFSLHLHHPVKYHKSILRYNFRKQIGQFYHDAIITIFSLNITNTSPLYTVKTSRSINLMLTLSDLCDKMHSSGFVEVNSDDE